MSPRRRALAAVAVLAVAGAASCSSSDDGTGRGARARGTALGGDLGGVVTGRNTSRSGVEYWVFFPVMTNLTATSLAVEGFSLASVDRSARVLGYTTFNADVPGNDHSVPTTWDTSHPYPPDPPGQDLRQARYRVRLPYPIAPKQESGTVGVARIELTRSDQSQQDPIRLSGCTVRYRQGGKRYEQTLGCTVAFE